MSWFSQNKFLAGFFVVLALAIGAAGYYLSTTYAKYRDAMDTFDQEKQTLAMLQGRPLFPSEENVKTIRDQSQAYEAKVLALQEELLKFQKPLDTTILNTEFPTFITEQVKNVRDVGATKGVKFPEEFYLGFPDYLGNFPRPPAVGLLHYQALAIKALLLQMVNAGVDEVISLDRDKLDVESSNYKEPESPAVLERYPIELVVSGDHESIRRFVNDISNDKEYFYNIRLMRIENSSKEGPTAGGSSGGGGVADPSGGLSGDLFPNFGVPTDGTAGMAAEQQARVVYDKIVMGQETIQAYLVIDVLRFVEVEVSGDAEAGAKGGSPDKDAKEDEKE